MSEKIIGDGKCTHCGEKIRWLVTGTGNFMPIQMDDNEPHFPHCGKGSWSAEDWAKMMIENGERILRNNKTKRITNPNNITEFYDGNEPPWD